MTIWIGARYIGFLSKICLHIENRFAIYFAFLPDILFQEHYLMRSSEKSSMILRLPYIEEFTIVM